MTTQVRGGTSAVGAPIAATARLLREACRHDPRPDPVRRSLTGADYV